MADIADSRSPVSTANGNTLFGQIEFFKSIPLIQTLLAVVPDVVFVINQQREIVFSNRALSGVSASGGESAVSLRPGSAFDCVHAAEDGTCGTTQFCRTCGANETLNASIGGVPASEECRITRTDGTSLDFRVWGKPLEIGGERFSVFVAQDISHEKRRRALERIFFHDVLNTAGSVYGFADLLQMATEDELAMIKNQLVIATERLVDEILAQRELTQAENNEIQPEPMLIDSLDLLKGVGDLYASHLVCEGKSVKIDPRSEPIVFESDATLLRRVLGNMVKNALEASNQGQTVTLYCGACDDGVEFVVHNPTVMPRDTRLQIFKRSFSTKGAGRGLGTYSMKLLTEQYLGGRISFSSSKAKGTCFRARYPLQWQ